MYGRKILADRYTVYGLCLYSHTWHWAACSTHDNPLKHCEEQTSPYLNLEYLCFSLVVSLRWVYGRGGEREAGGGGWLHVAPSTQFLIFRVCILYTKMQSMESGGNLTANAIKASERSSWCLIYITGELNASVAKKGDSRRGGISHFKVVPVASVQS